jgi:RimJ/RimL family protein N-acetyltransferase
MRLGIWRETDEYLDLLVRKNTPEMTAFLGGPEPHEKLVERNARYAALGESGAGRMFRILVPAPDGSGASGGVGGEAVAGSVGYWEREWRGATVYEAGWGVLPEFQGRGLAARAVAAVLADAAAERARRGAAAVPGAVHAYPKVEHAASNGVCRKVGFTLLGVCDFEYPPGHPIRCNDWRYELGDVSG